MGKVRRVGHRVFPVRIRLSGVLDHGAGSVDAGDPVAASLQVTREATLAAAEVQRQTIRRRQRLEEPIAVEAPVAVMARSASPGHPSICLRFPRIAEAPLDRIVHIYLAPGVVPHDAKGSRPDQRPDQCRTRQGSEDFEV